MPYEKQNFENGAILTAEQLNHMEEGIAQAYENGGVTSWNDLTDKPFYTEDGGGAEILPETTIASDEDLAKIPALNLEAGKEYEVTWNGVKYNCICQVLSGDGVTVACLGDVYTSSDGVEGTGPTGEPFFIGEFPPEFAAQIGGTVIIQPLGDTENITPITLSIMGNGEIIHKLDNKYLDLDWLPVVNKKETLVVHDAEFPADSTNVYDTEHMLSVGYRVLGETGKIVVYWDGVRYETNIVTFGEGSEAMSYAGNLGLFTESGLNTGEPFAMMLYSDHTFVNYPNSDNSHIASIYTLEEEPNKIPEAFLPDTVSTCIRFYVSGISDLGSMNYVYKDRDCTIRASTADVYKANLNGMIQLVHGYEVYNPISVRCSATAYRIRIITDVTSSGEVLTMVFAETD